MSIRNFLKKHKKSYWYQTFKRQSIYDQKYSKNSIVWEITLIKKTVLYFNIF